MALRRLSRRCWHDAWHSTDCTGCTDDLNEGRFELAEVLDAEWCAVPRQGLEP